MLNSSQLGNTTLSSSLVVCNLTLSIVLGIFHIVKYAIISSMIHTFNHSDHTIPTVVVLCVPMKKPRNQPLDHIPLYTSEPNKYFALCTLPILQTFVETDSNHSSHKTVTSCSNSMKAAFAFGARAGPSRNLHSSAFYAALSSQKIPYMSGVPPLLQNRKLDR